MGLISRFVWLLQITRSLLPDLLGSSLTRQGVLPAPQRPRVQHEGFLHSFLPLLYNRSRVHKPTSGEASARGARAHSLIRDSGGRL
jgi:hypothetical protein